MKSPEDEDESPLDVEALKADEGKIGDAGSSGDPVIDALKELWSK